MGRNLSNLYISESFQYLIQYSGSDLQDGLGNSLTGPFNVTASFATSASQAVTASYALNAGVTVSTASLLVTASATNNVITFTKGDSSTFNVTVATGSAVTVNTGSLLTTASFSNDQITFTKGDGSTFSGVINNVTSSISASFATNAISSSFATTSNNATSASFATNATSASFASTSTSASNALTANNANTASYVAAAVLTGSVSSNTLTFTKFDGSTFSLTVNTGSAVTVNTGSLLVTASINNATTTFTKGDGSTFSLTTNNVVNATSASLAANATTASFALDIANGLSPTFATVTASNVLITGTASVALLYTQTVSSSVIFTSGSNQLGDASNDTQTLWGTVDIKTGPLKVTGSTMLNGSTDITGGDFKVTDQGHNAEFDVDKVIIKTQGGTQFTGSVSSQNGFTGSLQGTASFANNATSASFATNATSASFASTSTSASFATSATSASFASTSTSSSFATSASQAQNAVDANTATSSSFASTASFTPNALVTASVSSNTITFTKGDGSTFPIVVNTGSAGGVTIFTNPSGSNNAVGYADQWFNYDSTQPGESTLFLSSSLIFSENFTGSYLKNAVIIGGKNNTADVIPGNVWSMDNSGIIGGTSNRLFFNGSNNFIIGGQSLTLESATTNNSVLLGGQSNRLYATLNSTIAGGNNIDVRTSSDRSFFAGGSSHTIDRLADSVVLGSTGISTGQGPVVSRANFIGATSLALNNYGIDINDNIAVINVNGAAGTRQFPDSWTLYTEKLKTFAGASLTGSILVSGSLVVNGETVRAADGFPYTGSAIISGSLNVIGKVTSGRNNTNNGNNSSVVLGGFNNTNSDADDSTVIIGGSDNTLNAGGLGYEAIISSYNCQTYNTPPGNAYGAVIIGSHGTENNAYFGITAGTINSDLQGQHTFILGGNNNSIQNANSAGTIGGINHTINGNVQRSVIIGGNGITATTDDTVYVPNLVITGSAVTASITNVIGNWTDTYTSSPKVSNIVTLTQAEYDAISGSANPNTMYVVSDTVVGTPATLTGNQTFTGTNTFTATATFSGSVRGDVSALSISSNTASLDLSTGNFFTIQLVSGSNTYINPTNILPGQTINLRINTTGSGTVSFPSSVKQVSGSAYVPTTTTGVDIVTLISFDTSSLYLSNVKNLV